MSKIAQAMVNVFQAYCCFLGVHPSEVMLTIE